MAFAGFKYDIFISYSHIDNYAPEGKPGWVDYFHTELESWLVRRFGHKKIEIWRDKQLKGNTLFDERIKEVINNSALFIALTSPHYFDSGYCLKELEWFYKQAEVSQYGLSVKNECRLFNVQLKNVPYTAWPEKLKNSGCFPMHDAPEKSDVPGEPINPHDLPFNKKLRQIVDAIDATLNAFPVKTITDSSGDHAGETFKVFVADVADSLTSIRDCLISDLSLKHIRVITNNPLFVANEEHDICIERAIKDSNLSIHLLNEFPGQKIIDWPDTTYPQKQVEIGLNSETPQMIWVPGSLNYEKIEDRSYQTFLQSLEFNIRKKKYEFLRSPKTYLSDLILEKINGLKQKIQGEDAYSYILLDTHQKDQRMAFKLAEFISSKNLKIEFNQELRDPVSSIRHFEESLKYATSLIIIFGEVTPSWVFERLKKAISIIDIQLKDENKKNLKKVWVYLLPPSRITPEITELANTHGIKFLDNRHSDYPDEKVIDRIFSSGNEWALSPNAPNPFVGLRPFESNDSLYFFGRKEQTDALLKRLYDTRFIAVIGSSGSGKSSLVRAGLIPLLEAGFLVQDRDLWHIARMKPGIRPIFNLAESLLRVTADFSQKTDDGKVSDFAESIRDKGIYAVLDQIGPRMREKDSNLFLLVDQFEEVFRFGLNTRDSHRRDEAAGFIDLLLRLSKQENIPVYVCLTMRSDYIGDCNLFPGLAEAMNRGQYLTPGLTRNQHREIIEGPIFLSGASITPRLLDRLLNESGENRDDLPILQHALMRTWDDWAKDKTGPLDLIHYERIQTVQYALSRHADEVLDELTNDEKEIAKRLFQTLTEMDDENRRIRRPSRLSKVIAITHSSADCLMGIIAKFREKGRSFLVLSSENPSDDPLVEISHESLMRQWVTLENWMNEEAESAKIYKHLAEEAELYNQGKVGLYRGPGLSIALNWKEKEKPTEAWAKQYHNGFETAIAFLDRSHSAHSERLAREENERHERERLLREKADLMEKQAAQRHRALHQTRIFTVVIFIIMVIAAGFAYLSLKKSEETKNQKRDANYNLAKAFEEKAMSALNTDHDPTLAWLHTFAALKQEIDPNKLHLYPENANALFKPEIILAAFAQQWSSPLPLTDFHSSLTVSNSDTSYTVAFSPDGKIIASGALDKIIRLWDVESGKEIQKLTGHLNRVNCVTFSPDGRILASGSDDNTVRLWNLSSGKEIRVFTGHSSWVNCVAFTGDGMGLASGSSDGTIKLWDVSSGKEVRSFIGHSGAIKSIVFSHDKNILASGSDDQTIRLWDAGTGRAIRIFTGHSGAITSIALSSNGKWLVSGSDDKTIRLWDIASGKERWNITGHSGPINSVAFSPDSQTLISGSDDKTIRLWDSETGQELRKFSGHSDAVYSVAFSPDGKSIASISRDNTLRFWKVSVDHTIKSLVGHSDGVTAVVYSPDGRTLASSSDDQTVRLWDVASGKEIRTLTGHSDRVSGVGFSPDGKTLASGSMDKTIRLWDIRSGKQTRVLTGHSDCVYSIAFSPDGKILASGSMDKTIRLWNVDSGKLIQLLTGHSGTVYTVAFSPSGKTLASGSKDKTVRLWDVSSGKQIRVLTGYSDWVYSVTFSPDGKMLASGNKDKMVRLWDVVSGEQVRILRGHSDWVSSVAFSSDGKTLASGSHDNTVRLWDVASGEEIREIGGNSDVINCVRFSPDGNTVVFASGSMDKTIRLCDIRIFNLFLKGGKSTPLFYHFIEGVEFFWGLRQNGLEYINERRAYNRKILPLLNPPGHGQSKFEQIIEWAKKQN
ncbi:MAG: TIR domain-containing protein [Candidatus Omnitrophota bacterium]